MNENKRVILSEIDIPFVDIVKLMVKWSLASIPALIILSSTGSTPTISAISLIMLSTANIDIGDPGARYAVVLGLLVTIS